MIGRILVMKPKQTQNFIWVGIFTPLLIHHQTFITSHLRVQRERETCMNVNVQKAHWATKKTLARTWAHHKTHSPGLHFLTYLFFSYLFNFFFWLLFILDSIHFLLLILPQKLYIYIYIQYFMIHNLNTTMHTKDKTRLHLLHIDQVRRILHWHRCGTLQQQQRGNSKPEMLKGPVLQVPTSKAVPEN